MTTAMIEISSFNEKTLTKTTIAPFAWFSWPMEIGYLVLRSLGNAFDMMTTGKPVIMTGGPVKELLIKRGGLRDIKQQEILRTGSLTPFRKIIRYEDANDFKEAAKF